MWEYRCQILRVIDGDTVEVLVDLGFNVSHRLHVRFNDVDAPEIRGPEKPEGLAIKDALEAHIGWYHNWRDKQEWPWTLRTEKGRSFNRWVGEIVYTETGASLTEYVKGLL